MTHARGSDVSPFVGDGEMAARMRTFDWSATTLGPVSKWPQSLRIAVGICLASRYPMVIWWGRDLVLLYNDAWVPILGPDKHPALGKPGIAVWPEMWHIIGSQLNSVVATGQATYCDDQLLPAMRFGYLEEAYFTYSYSPIRNESGAVGGVFTAVTETTQRVLSDRRLRTLRTLGEKTALATTEGEASVENVCVAAMDALADDRADVPFAAMYRLNPGDPVAHLVCSMGIADPSVLSAAVYGSVAGLVLRDIVDTGESTILDALPQSWVEAIEPGASPAGNDPPLVALILPVQAGGDELPTIVMVAGVTPYRRLDDDFRGFFDLATAQVSRAINDAQLYQSQRARAEALTELDRARNEFFANVSHEFRTPLTLIAGPAEDSLNDTAEPLTATQRDRLELIRRNAGRLRHLVDDLLDFSRIEAGKRQPELQPVDLAATTRELVAAFTPAVARAGLELHTEIDSAPTPFLVDVDMWEKIVLNLLSNAVKYTPKGRVEVSLRHDDGHVTLTVKDTGIGIPQDQLPRVFERFHRIRGRTGRSHEGAGIGLALTAELVRLHRGTVEVASAEDQGSTFTVTLPYPVPTEPSASTDSSPRLARAYTDEALRWSEATDAPGGAAPAHSDSTVLVVEDNADMRTFITKVLSPHWRVLQAVDGAEGLEIARAHRPDLVLTDVMMPRLDGFGLLARLREDPRTASVPVVFLSARAGEEAAVGGLAAGADDYLPKPFSTAELLARVRSNLEMARLRNREADFRRTLIDSMQEGFFLCDDAGTIVEANQAFFTLTGYDATGLPYPWPQPWVPPADEDPAGWLTNETAFAQCQREGSGHFMLPFRHADGHTVWVACSAGSVKDPRTNERLFVGTARDVTAEHLEYEQTRAVALTLQHAILGPTRLPHGFAVRYTPAVEPFEVGGDWYDVVPLDEGRIGIVVGDSVGRGLPAAAVMGQLRSAAQALLLRTPQPAQALADLDNFARRLPSAECTTVFCAVIDPARSTVRYSSAGHPPPVLVDRTGVQVLDRAQSVPLAATETVWSRPESEASLLPGATLLLYTDGLIERRHESLVVGIERAATALNRYRHCHPDYVADALMTDLVPPAGFDDDVAVLLYRHPPSSLTLRSPAMPASLATIRDSLRRWLPAAAINPDTAEEVLLAVGEAAANATEHAANAATHDVELTVTAQLTKAGLSLTVTDDGRWHEPTHEPNRGHGIALMNALVDAVEISSTSHGTTVDMLKELQP